jgi:TolA-binding protein
MSMEAGLIRLRLSLKRKEYQRTFTTARVLLSANPKDPQRGEVLYDLAQAGYALGKTNQARQAVLELLRDFPFSEPAARAKDQWARM